MHWYGKCFAQLWLQIFLPSWDVRFIGSQHKPSSIACQAIGQVQMNHFILPFPKFYKLNLPFKIGNSALRGLGKGANRINTGHLLETIWNLQSKCDCSTYFLENLRLSLSATATSVPTETARLLSLKKAVPGLDKYLICLYLGNFLMAWQFLVLKKL